jgi:hypothetical protein
VFYHGVVRKSVKRHLLVVFCPVNVTQHVAHELQVEWVCTRLSEKTVELGSLWQKAVLLAILGLAVTLGTFANSMYAYTPGCFNEEV